jgi:hypothetical protein
VAAITGHADGQTVAWTVEASNVEGSDKLTAAEEVVIT